MKKYGIEFFVRSTIFLAQYKSFMMGSHGSFMINADMTGDENRLRMTFAKGLQRFQLIDQRVGDVVKIQHSVDVETGDKIMGGGGVAKDFFEALPEGLDVFRSDRQSDGHLMTAELQEILFTHGDTLKQVHPGNASA